LREGAGGWQLPDPSEPNTATSLPSLSWRRRIVTSESVDLLNHLNQSTFTSVRKVVPLDTTADFFFSRDQLDLGRVSLVHVRCTPVELDVLPSSHLIVVISENGQSLYQGRGLEVTSSRGDAAIIPNYGESIYRSSSDSRFAVQVPYDVWAEQIEAGQVSSIRTRLNKPVQLDLSSGPATHFRCAMNFIWSQSTPESTLLRAAFDEVMLHGLVGLVAPAFSDRLQGRLLDPGVDRIRRACEILRSRVNQPIRIADIARELGVGVRHLQAGFRRHLAITPLQFLRECRLDQAHRRLSNALPGETTTSIAFDCGFAHLGDFAQDYRRRFGEVPSETLRRHKWHEPAVGV
jgi:AraC-like DNA-binding protein